MSWPPPLVSWLLVSIALIVIAFFLWRRSTGAMARRIHRRILELQPEEMPTFFDRETAVRLPPERGSEILERAARLLEKNDHPLAIVVRTNADLWRHIPFESEISPIEDRLALADILETQAEALTRLGKLSERHEQVSRSFALQNWFFAAMLRAESPSHLAALSDDLAELEQWAERTRALPQPFEDLYADLRAVIRALDQLAHLPGAEDRSLFLGQALTRLLTAQERLAEHRAQGPSYAAVVMGRVFESTRDLLATALRDIRQRAQLSATLRSRTLTTRREAVLVLDLRNVGRGHAENIVVELRGPETSLRIIEPRQYVRRLLRDQSARLEFAVEPRLSERVRVRFHITYDDLERQGQVRELADVVELRHDQRRSDSFRTLQPNPYVVGRPLTPEDLFIGREEVFERFESSLRGAHQDNVVVLIGQRRMGKTSILKRLDRYLGEDYVPVLVDLQGMLSTGEAAFLHEIAASVCDELEERGLEVREPDAEAFAADPGGAFRRAFLRRVRRSLGDRRLLLIFDELEVLEERIAGGDLDRKILPFFRSVMQHERGVSFVFAGTHRLEELTGDYWGVLFNLAVYLQVGHLPQDEVEKLFVEPTREVFDIDPLALEKAYRVTGGHPHFSQLLARELVELRNRERLTYITVREVNRVAERVVDKGQLHISYLWEESTRSERFLLLALVALLDQEGSATVPTAHRHLVGRRVEPGDLPAAARALVYREILDERAGQLSFRIDLLRLWIERYRDLESFLLSESGEGREASRA